MPGVLGAEEGWCAKSCLGEKSREAGKRVNDVSFTFLANVQTFTLSALRSHCSVLSRGGPGFDQFHLAHS